MTPLFIFWDDLGSRADVFAAAGSILAVIVASFAAWATIRTNQAQQQTLALQQKQHQLELEARKRSQAEKITFLGEILILPDLPMPPLVRVFNASDSVVYGVSIQYIFNTDGQEPVLRTIHLTDVLEPSKGVQTFEIVLNEDVTGEGVPKNLVFRDAGGRVWRRHRNGELEEGSFERPILISGSATLV